ncbi:MAG: hypothetical protein WC666_00080 [Candidatus Paceibacterota bacterium]|jgi:hypothetical protein
MKEESTRNISTDINKDPIQVCELDRPREYLGCLQKALSLANARILPDEVKWKVETIVIKIREAIGLFNKLNEELEQIQRNCQHSLEEVWGQDNELGPGEHTVETLVAKICWKCRYIERRPDGEYWQICSKCWSKMNFSHLEDPFSIYRCSQCYHCVIR